MPRAPKSPAAKEEPVRPATNVTLYDVAERARVSGMTVSRVINGNAHVSEKTREKVMKAIGELGYTVNVAARAARVGTLRVGLLYSNPSAAFLSAFLVGAMGQCNRSGAELILEHCEDLKTQRKAIERLIAMGADGILVPPPLCDSRSALKHLKEIGMPTVAVATAKPSPQASAVRIDDYDGARSMTKYLLSAGHKDIAFIKGDPEHTPAQLRYQAFIDTMREEGLPVPAERIAQGMFTYRSGLVAARELLSQKVRPTAIFASNDDMAAAAIAVAHGMHLQVPEDIAIAGFDDTPVAVTVWPELTTIHQPIGDMGRAAVEMIVDHVRERRAGHEVVPRHQLMPYTLEVRESTAPAEG
ncbi:MULTISPECIES: LacI family DNA-binding transcriptional regulator [unclassified Duganella]|uniref:LacI family DNA-binding transcriptional regulator n=1 Tax=unclassified Duganella TaxID=2636909 RepID=UPI00088271FA|nr:MULTISPECIES: LacI family DNA-binding transcriptional regulator [unclassified Duganella]SDF66466.1 transcriptional regulator, LacI family [Duganella sp. OV458]SDI62529.1 transcriptional regulator, LacI family [Duganella sp. OV510]